MPIDDRTGSDKLSYLTNGRPVVMDTASGREARLAVWFRTLSSNVYALAIYERRFVETTPIIYYRNTDCQTTEMFFLVIRSVRARPV